MSSQMQAAPVALALLLGALAACSSTREEAGPAPMDRGVQTGTADTSVSDDAAVQQDRRDTTVVRTQPDTVVLPDTSIATPPINPAPSTTGRDSALEGGAQPTSDQPNQGTGGQISQLEYEGWRQYSVNCARCHGQDVLPNPVAANLLISLAPGGPIDSYEKFAQVVIEGRPERGMPAFKGTVSAEQTQAIYAYVKGRADKRIPAGRPERPGA